MPGPLSLYVAIVGGEVKAWEESEAEIFLYRRPSGDLEANMRGEESNPTTQQV